jgi:hypothetical protein
MKLRLLILLAAALAASPAAGQTIKSLGYNTTNGNIVAATNVTFTNSVGFATNAQAATRTNLGGTTVGDSVFTATNAAAAATAIGLGTANDVTFNRVQVGGATFTADDFSGGNFEITAAHALTFASGGTPGATLTNLGLGAANNVTFSNITASGTLGVTGNATFSGTANLAPSQTASSGSSLMTRDLGDARFSPMPMTPQIIPWFYNGSLSVTRVTNGSATFGTSAAYPTINLTTNASDSGATILIDQVWGAVDSAANPWNAVGRSVIIQGRLASTGTNAVARFVWSSSANWPTIMTNLGTNGISNLGWAVETRKTGVWETRLIVHGATNISESEWTPIGYNPGNDSSLMVVGRAGFTSLYWTSTGEPFSRTPLITVTNQIGGSISGAFQGGLGFSIINTNTPAGTSTIYIRRCYQVLGMTNYGY